MAQLATTSIDKQQLLSKLQLVASGTPSELFPQIEALAALDKVAEKQQAKFGTIGALLIVAAIALAIVSVGWVALILLIASICSFVACAKAGKLNIPNERHQLADKVLRMVSRDMRDGDLAHLTVELAPATAKQFKIAPPPGRRADRSFYQCEWLKLRGVFADGTKFSLGITQHTHVKFRKGKVKDKGTVAKLILLYPDKRYHSVNKFADKARASIQLPRGTILKSMRLNNRSLRLVTKMPPMFMTSLSLKELKDGGQAELLYKNVASMFLSSYQVLNLARILTKSAAGGESA